MLANNANEEKKQSEFFHVIRPHQAVAELMTECTWCGAMTSSARELAWRLGKPCPAASADRSMSLDEDNVECFRERLRDAMVRVDALLRG